MVTTNQQVATVRTTIKVLDKDEAPEGIVPLDSATRKALEKLLRTSTWTQTPAGTATEPSDYWSVSVRAGEFSESLAKPDLPLIFADVYYVAVYDHEDGRVPIEGRGEPRFLGTFHTISSAGPTGSSNRFTSSFGAASGPLPEFVTLIVRLTPERARELTTPAVGFSGEIMLDEVRIRKAKPR